jgi:hypothetical protein
MSKDLTNKNCSVCNSSLYLNDVVSNTWDSVNNVENFILKCSSCNHRNVVTVDLFKDGHISSYNLQMLRVDKNYFPKEQFDKITEHLQSCDVCKSHFEDTLLAEIEDNTIFNDKTVEFFNKHGLLRMKKAENIIFEKNNITQIIINKNKFELTQEDEFYRDKNTVGYYLRQDLCLYGLISFIFDNNEIFIERIWMRTLESVEKEKVFFDQLKNKKIKIDLKTIETIFKRIH